MELTRRVSPPLQFCASGADSAGGGSVRMRLGKRKPVDLDC